MAKFAFRSWLGQTAKRLPQNGSTDLSKPQRQKEPVTRLPTHISKDRELQGAASSSDDENRAGMETQQTKAASEMTLLANTISQETQKLGSYMAQHGLAMPSFDIDSAAEFPKLPKDMQQSRLAIIDATKRLRNLAIGPQERVRWAPLEALDVLALQLVYSFGLAKLVPIHGSITLAELQTKTALDGINLARVLRLAMTNDMFREPAPGTIAHTASSRALAEDADLQAWVGFNTEDIFPAMGRVLEALKAHPEATSPLRTGFNVMAGTVDVEPMFKTFGRQPERARRMGRAMASLTGGEGYEVVHLVDVARGGYDFGAVDAAGGTFVDVGGSHGFVCRELARVYRNMRFVVQDLPQTVASAPQPIDEDAQVAARIGLQAHDFFTEQVVKGADVYFFRWIMHNHSTPFAATILRNLVPALKPGARVLINDHCLREPGQETPWDEQIMRRMDMVMLVLLNAQERSEDEYRALFAAAHEDYVFVGVRRPIDCRMSIIEAVWQPKQGSSAAETA